MTAEPDGGRPLPTLLVVLIGSFVLMLLSGIFFMAGLPEDLARALFLGTVVMWFALGIAVIVKGRLDVRDLERERTARARPVPRADAANADAGPEAEGD